MDVEGKRNELVELQMPVQHLFERPLDVFKIIWIIRIHKRKTRCKKVKKPKMRIEKVYENMLILDYIYRELKTKIIDIIFI